MVHWFNDKSVFHSYTLLTPKYYTDLLLYRIVDCGINIVLIFLLLRLEFESTCLEAATWVKSLLSKLCGFLLILTYSAFRTHLWWMETLLGRCELETCNMNWTNSYEKLLFPSFRICSLLSLLLLLSIAKRYLVRELSSISYDFIFYPTEDKICT